MSRSNSELDRLRSGRTELENHYIDELVSGNLSRRDFLRRGSTIGMSIPLLGAILAACGGGSSSSASTSGGSSTSAGSPDQGRDAARRVGDPGRRGQPADDRRRRRPDDDQPDRRVPDLRLEPEARASADARAELEAEHGRQRVDVQAPPGGDVPQRPPMTADDVVYTFQQLSDPKNASSALSTFTGVLTPAGVKKVDASTVEFHLEAPNANFPYFVSSDNYGAIIVPKGTDYGKWQTTFIGTGAFKLGSYTQNVGATFVPNPNYWGTKPLPPRRASSSTRAKRRCFSRSRETMST